MPSEPSERPVAERAPADPSAAQSGSGRWMAAALRFLGVLFCLEIGAFLLIFPWLTYWDQNYFSGIGERWYWVWTSPFLRGAVSGLGMLNLYISFWDLLDLLRAARHESGRPHSIE